MVRGGFGCWHQIFQQAADDGTLQAKRKVTGVTEQRHFKNLIAVYEGDAVLPFGQAEKIPHFPEHAANDRGHYSCYCRGPISRYQVGQYMPLVRQGL